MEKRKPIIIGKKLRGEWAEMMFMARATELGIAVSKPWGESRSYDFVVGWPGHFVAVQVKSTTSGLEPGWVCKLSSRIKPYPPGSFDFLAAYIVFEDAWYIIPEKEVLGMDNITLHTGSSWANYEHYREAWHLLGDRDKDKGIDLQGCAEEVLESAASENFHMGEGSSGGGEMRPRGLEALNPFRWLTRR